MRNTGNTSVDAFALVGEQDDCKTAVELRCSYKQEYLSSGGPQVPLLRRCISASTLAGRYLNHVHHWFHNRSRSFPSRTRFWQSLSSPLSANLYKPPEFRRISTTKRSTRLATLVESKQSQSNNSWIFDREMFIGGGSLGTSVA